VGAIIPEFVVSYHSNAAAPGAASQWLFSAPRACRIVAIRETHSTAGAGASVLNLRKHAAGQTGAPSAAVSGTAVQELVTGGVAADGSANVPRAATVVTAAGANQLAKDAKIALVTPATWIGMVELYLVWD